jgi:hypothetical protein
MRLGDYDHGGRATEFVLQIGASPCGHRQGVLVGVSRGMPRLHAFGTAERPEVPLVLQHTADWHTLLHAGGSVRVIEIWCGDHSSETETELELRTDRKGIHATRREYECEKKGTRGSPSVAR